MSATTKRLQDRSVAAFGVLLGLAVMAAGVIPAVRAAEHAAVVQRAGHVEPPTEAERRAGCGGVRTDKEAGARRHAFGRIEYPTAPPSTGEHNPDPLPDARRFYTAKDAAAPERAVHNLEHGYVVIWFDSTLSWTEQRELRTSVAEIPRVIAVAWTRGRFPDAKPIAVTAWRHTERCARVDIEVVRNFVKRYGDRSPERGGLGGSLAPASQV